MHSEYAMAVPQPPRSRSRRRRRRQAGILRMTALLAAVLIVPALWRGLNGGVPCVQYGPVKIIYQNPELPNGCEVTSLAMALTSAGCPADKLTLYRDYLPKGDFSLIDGRRFGPSPEKWYVGDARDLTGGWYCFEGPILQAADGWLEHCGSDVRAQSATGLSRAELDRCAREKVPLVVWVTLGYAAPRYSEFTWLLEDGTAYRPYSNLHCVVLAGEEDGQYRVADPISGFAWVDKDLFWDSFSAMGCRAVIIRPEN